MMKNKRWARNQTRNGNPARRRLEYEAVMDQMTRNRERFLARLKRRMEGEGECIAYRGTLDHNGYPRMNLRFRGQVIAIHAMRVVMILKTGAPIPEGHDVAHVSGCKNRRCVSHIELQHYKINATTDPEGKNFDQPSRSH